MIRSVSPLHVPYHLGSPRLVHTSWCVHVSQAFVTWHHGVYMSVRHLSVRRHMPAWHAHTMINVWINDCEPSLYGSGESGLIMKTWCKFNKVNRPWKWGQGQVTNAWLTCTHHDVWTKHGDIIHFVLDPHIYHGVYISVRHMSPTVVTLTSFSWSTDFIKFTSSFHYFLHHLQHRFTMFGPHIYHGGYLSDLHLSPIFDLIFTVYRCC
jgi:hypothetical protein